MNLRFILIFAVGIAAATAVLGVLAAAGVLQVNPEVGVRAIWVGAIVSLSVAVVVWVTLWGVLKRLSTPIDRIVEAIAAINSGNLSPRLPAEAPGEFGIITEGLRTMCGQMRMVLAQLSTLSSRVVASTDSVGESFQEVQEGAKTQTQTAARTFDAVGQLSDGLLAASRTMEVLARRIDENAATVMQMDHGIRRIAETVGGLISSIEQASSSTREGDRNVRVVAGDIGDLSSRVDSAQGALREMMDGAQKARNDSRDAAQIMARLEAETEQIGAAIEAVIGGSDAVHVSNERILEVTASLSSRVDQVDQVIEVIRSLAERTKLLSINASIIASEAGEHGRAFAVVAHEVKDLAQSTAGAISEISRVVAGLKDGFTQTVTTIQQGQADVDWGVRLARDAVVLLRSIPDAVHRAASRNSEIVARTERQVEKGAQVEEIMIKVATALGQVTRLLAEQVNRNERSLLLFQSISLTAEQVVSSTREHAKSSGEVCRGVEKISGDFRSLGEQVRRHVSALAQIVKLAEDVLNITERNRRRSEELSTVIGDLNRYALYLGEDFRKLKGEEPDQAVSSA